MKFCVKCGKCIKKGVFCSDCDAREDRMICVELMVCGCGKFYKGKRWTSAGIESVLKMKKCTLLTGFDVCKAVQDNVKETVLEFDCGDELKRVKVKILPNTCPECHKQKTKYFQGVLQVRSKSKEMQEMVAKMIGGMIRRKGSFISQVVNEKDGADLYFSDKRHMKNIADRIHSELGGNISHNPQLFSRDKQKSKHIYRLNTLLELPNFVQGNVILFEDIPCVVQSLGKMIKAKSLDSGKTIKFSFKNPARVLKKHTTKVSRVRPGIEVIHPETFQSEKPVNSVSGLKPGENVKVVVHKGVYLIY